VAEREFDTLGLLQDLGIPAPAPIWCDPTAATFGCPALVMTRMPGHPWITPRDPVDWLGQLARALATIHGSRLDGRESGLRDGNGWLTRRVLIEPSAESRARHVDIGAVSSVLRDWWPRIAPVEPTLVHCDFWAGNTLWRRERLVGIVDWDSCGFGDPRAEVGYCRMDLAMMIGPEAPDIFLEAYVRASGRAVAPIAFWDLVGASAALPELDDWVPGYHDLGRTEMTSQIMHARLRAFTADALLRATHAT
jgi:aminoglycoside phosphotransferase (APT) family kinase protein